MPTMFELVEQPYVLLTARWVIGFLLLIGGIGKLVSLREFKKLIAAYRLLPEPIAPRFASTLPIVELVVGTALLFKLFSPAAELVAAGLFLIFIGAIAINLLRGRRELPCGCFGSKENTISWHLVTRNLALVGLALLSTGKLTSISASLFALYGFSAAVRSGFRSKASSVQPST